MEQDHSDPECHSKDVRGLLSLHVVKVGGEKATGFL